MRIAPLERGPGAGRASICASERTSSLWIAPWRARILRSSAARTGFHDRHRVTSPLPLLVVHVPTRPIDESAGPAAAGEQALPFGGDRDAQSQRR